MNLWLFKDEMDKGGGRVMKKVLGLLLFIGLTMTVFAQDMFSATRNGDLEQVKNLVEKANVSVDVLDSNHQTPLFGALGDTTELSDQQKVDENRIAILTYLINKGAHLDVVDEYGYTPLIYALEYGREDATRLLLENGANYIKIVKIDGVGTGSPFDFAIANLTRYVNYNREGCFFALNALCDYDLTHGRKLNYEMYQDNYIIAIICDDLGGLKKIVSKGDDIGDAGYTAFLLQKTDILDWLAEIGQFDPNKKPTCDFLDKYDDGTYFEWAEQQGDSTMKSYLSKFTRTEAEK